MLRLRTATITLSAALTLPLVALARGGAEVESYDAATFYQTTSYFGASFSPDEKRIAFSSDESGVYNVWSMPVTGGEATMLTGSDGDALLSLGFFPADERLLYTADQGGNELNHRRPRASRRRRP